MATEVPLRAPYPLVQVASSNEVNRPGTPWGTTADLIGVDGSLQGGLRPFQGFEKVYELDFYNNDLHDETSVVNYYKPVHFRIGSEQYGFGFVYRAVRSRRLGGDTTGNASSATVSKTTATGSHSFSTGADLGSSTSSGNAYGAPGKADVFIDFWNSGADTATAFSHTGEPLAIGVDPDAQMDVVVVGRLIYVFISGRDPALFYVDTVEELSSIAPVTTSSSGSTSSGRSSQGASYSLKKLGLTSAGPFPGPGRQCLCVSPQNATGLGQLAVPPAPVLYRRPAVGQIVLTNQGPAASGLFSNNVPGVASESLSGRGSGSFSKTTNAGGGTLSSSFDERSSDGQGSNYSTRSSSSSIGSTPGVEITSSSGESSPAVPSTPASYSDPTSSCSGTSGTASLSANAPAILAGTCVFGPRPLPPNSVGLNATGVLDVTPNVSLSIIGRSRSQDPFGTFSQLSTRRSPIRTMELYCVDLEDYRNNPAVLDTPVATITFGVDAFGSTGLCSVRPADYMTLKPGHTYLYGYRLFNGSTACGILVGNADEPVNPGMSTNIEPDITEDEFVNNRLGGKFKFRVRDAIPVQTSASSEDPGPALDSKFRAERFEAGDYVWGYYLYDSKTGRKSAFSEVAQGRQEDFERAEGTTSPASADKEVLYVVLEMAYDPTKFDQAYIFRSVKVQDAGGTLVAANQHLECIIKLADYHTNKNQAGGQWYNQTYKHVAYWYKLEDKQLIWQDLYYDKAFFDEAMPKGGAAAFYANTMFVSKINDPGPKSTADEIRPDDAIRGVGELRWSSTYNYSPELFPPGSRFVPSVPTSDPTTYLQAGANLIGFAVDRLYHIRREGSSVKPQEMHEGYGIVGPKAKAGVGSEIFYVTPKGLKRVTTFGELADIRVMDLTIIHEWTGILSNVSMAYDAELGALLIYNPDDERLAIVWMNTLLFSEVIDLPFHSVEQGVWPATYTDYRSSLTPRAFFLQNPPKQSASDIISGFKPRIFVIDHDRSRTNGNNRIRVTTLPIVGENSRSTASLSGTTLTVDDSPLPTEIEGAYVYCLDSSDVSYIGKKAKIIRRLSSTTLQIASGSQLVGLPASSRVGISPVFFQWIGANLPMMSDDGTQFAGQDFNRVRHIDAIGTSFVDVTGDPAGDSTTDAKYEAIVMRGTSETPYRSDFARNNSGDIVASITDYEATYWAAIGHQGSTELPSLGVRGTSIAPGVRIYCPDLDYRLLSVVAKAKILDTERTQMPS